MPLEAVLIAVDNSEWTRNGDYAPTRFSAQCEAVSYLANAKLQENQESSVGLMTMAGARIQVLISPGREPGQLLNSLAKDVHIGGKSNFLAALKTAQLALKNRQNKNQKQRVIMFVASPLVECDVGELVKLGKMFKKNNVAIDVINFGTENTTNDNTEKLEQLIAAVNTADNSHLVSIPPGPHIFADLVLTSAIMQSGGGGGGMAGVPSAAGGGASAANHPGGIDPNMDPEMAMVLRMSMEEERQRQQKAAGAAPAATAGGAPAAAAAPMEEDEEALLAQAIALSMQENAEAPMADVPAADAPAASAAATPAAAAAAAPASAASAADIDLAMQDPDFINSLLAGVSGADGQSVDNLLDELTGGDANKPKDDSKKEGDKK